MSNWMYHNCGTGSMSTKSVPIGLANRARWIGPSEQKMPKIKTGHTYFYEKLNFKVGLFSCIFLFEAIFIFGPFFPLYKKINIKCQKNSRRWPQIKLCKKANPVQNSILHKNTCDQSKKIILLYSTRPTGNCSNFLFWLTKSTYLVSCKLSVNLL